MNGLFAGINWNRTWTPALGLGRQAVLLLLLGFWCLAWNDGDHVVSCGPGQSFKPLGFG